MILKMLPGIITIIAFQIVKAIEVATKAGDECGSTVYVLIAICIVQGAAVFYLFNKNLSQAKEKNAEIKELNIQNKKITDDYSGELKRRNEILEQRIRDIKG